MRNHFLRHHALGTGIHLAEAAPFYPGPLAGDHAGITNTAGHEDIQVRHGTDFWTPVGEWTVTQLYLSDVWGWTLTIASTIGDAVHGFMHMFEVNEQLPARFGGGQWLGKSGGVPGEDPGVTPGSSGGAHLHHAYNDAAKSEAHDHYGDAAFTRGVYPWEYGEPLVPGGTNFHRGTAH